MTSPWRRRCRWSGLLGGCFLRQVFQLPPQAVDFLLLLADEGILPIANADHALKERRFLLLTGRRLAG
ncbi:hypothetical protein [Bremerella sp.]|uniref:hypothetical protein n=1 Tax=Bremerella sp. TaxID=2795602 RepID=UPI0039189A66